MAANPVRVEIADLDRVTDGIRRIPSRLFDQAKKIMGAGTIRAQKAVKGRLDGAPLHRRSGRLARSIRTSVSGGSLADLRASVYSGGGASTGSAGGPVVYAPIHEYGGTITAKNAYKGVPGGPYLNIPTQYNKTPAGVMRLNAREVFAAGGFIRGKTVFSGGENPLPMFSLVKSVEIPARLGMGKAADAEVPTILSDLAEMAAF